MKFVLAPPLPSVRQPWEPLFDSVNLILRGLKLIAQAAFVHPPLPARRRSFPDNFPISMRLAGLLTGLERIDLVSSREHLTTDPSCHPHKKRSPYS
jgi:hypothetical protein